MVAVAVEVGLGVLLVPVLPHPAAIPTSLAVLRAGDRVEAFLDVGHNRDQAGQRDAGPFALPPDVNVDPAARVDPVAFGFERRDHLDHLGEAFRAGAAVIVPVIALGAFIGGMRSFVYDLAFQVTKNTGAQARVLFVTVVVNVVLNLALIDRYGAAGAAFATLLSHAVALCLSVLLGRKLLRVNAVGVDALKVLLAATLAFGSLLLFDLAANVVELMSKALASGLGYGALFLIAALVSTAGAAAMALGVREPRTHQALIS